jgi:hypothetical protein
MQQKRSRPGRYISVVTPRPGFPLDLADIEAYRDWRVDLAGFHRGAFCGYVLVFVIPLEGQPS